MKSYLDLLKLLPKTNCKECGEVNCLLFALKVFSKETSVERCPYLNLNLLPTELFSQNLTFNQLLENLKYLKDKFRNLPSFLERAKNLGCRLSPEGREIYLPYLDLEITIILDEKVAPREIKNSSNASLDPRDEILICNYFIFNGKSPLSHEYVGLEFFPHSISKVKTLKKYAEEPLAQILSTSGDVIEKIFKDFEIKNLVKSSSEISFYLRVLPRVILSVNFWYGDEEENLPASCKILYDKNILSYLDLEGLVFCAERFIERLKTKVSNYSL